MRIEILDQAVRDLVEGFRFYVALIHAYYSEPNMLFRHALHALVAFFG
jgi:hypothetical protein